MRVGIQLFGDDIQQPVLNVDYICWRQRPQLRSVHNDVFDYFFTKRRVPLVFPAKLSGECLHLPPGIQFTRLIEPALVYIQRTAWITGKMRFAHNPVGKPACAKIAHVDSHTGDAATNLDGAGRVCPALQISDTPTRLGACASSESP